MPRSRTTYLVNFSSQKLTIIAYSRMLFEVL